MQRLTSRPTVSNVFYHVAGAGYVDGDDLLSWNTYTDLHGCPPGDWKWDDVEEGYDGDLVCLFRSISEAREYRRDFGGTILVVTVPDEEWGVGTVENDEGYEAILDRIPAEWISRYEG